MSRGFHSRGRLRHLLLTTVRGRQEAASTLGPLGVQVDRLAVGGGGGGEAGKVVVVVPVAAGVRLVDVL